MSHGRAQPRHRRRKSDFFGSPAKQSIDAPPAAAPEAADDDWVRCHDAATGASYYANRRSFEVSWTPPPAVTASAPAPPPVVVAAEASVAAPPPARARRAADAAWIGRGGAALAKATREAPTPVVAPPSPPTPEPPPPPTPEPTPEPPPPPEPDDEPPYEEFVVVDERTDSGTEGSGASYEEFMFYKGSLVYAGQLGGEKIRVASEFKPYKMLYVEPTFSDMIWGEKLLRKLRFSWDLCSSASEAQNLKQVAERASIEKGERKAAYDVVLVADSLALSDAGPLQRLFKQGDGDALVVGLAALKGPDGALALSKARFNSKKQGLTKDVEAVLPSHVASICDLAMTKPLKGGALEDLLEVLGERRQSQADSDGAPSQDLDYRGLTTKSLMRKCYSALQAGQAGRTISDPSKQKKRKKIPLAPSYPVTKKWTFPAPPLDQKIEPLIDLTFPVAGHTTL